MPSALIPSVSGRIEQVVVPGIAWSAVVLVLALTGRAQAQPSITSDAQVIHSEVLTYDLQYWVYTPAGYDTLRGLPVLYLSDGAWYKDTGNMPVVLDMSI